MLGALVAVNDAAVGCAIDGDGATAVRGAGADAAVDGCFDAAVDEGDGAGRDSSGAFIERLYLTRA
jgi:hypothetical protein